MCNVCRLTPPVVQLKVAPIFGAPSMKKENVTIDVSSAEHYVMLYFNATFTVEFTTATFISTCKINGLTEDMAIRR